MANYPKIFKSTEGFCGHRDDYCTITAEYALIRNELVYLRSLSPCDPSCKNTQNCELMHDVINRRI